jgi:tRNA (mo5U34)-methyltransferase
MPRVDSARYAAQARDARAAIAEQPFWYHTLELAPGVETPGMFDLRPIANRLPWPDVRGKRCLDVGTFDGFFAFELERRGAAEVVATDITNPEGWDWPPHLRQRGIEFQRTTYGTRTGTGFEIARELLGSAVERRLTSVYELSPDTVGTFDVVVCGSLLLHLRDPLRALQAIRSVCREAFLSSEQVRLATSVLLRSKPVFVFEGRTDLAQWFVPNVAAHRDVVAVSGFAIERESGMYSIPYGSAHPRQRGLRPMLRTASRKVLTRTDGVVHSAVLARPVCAQSKTDR